MENICFIKPDRLKTVLAERVSKALTGKTVLDNPIMYAKAIFLILWVIVSYYCLVFASVTGWNVLVYGSLLTLGLVGVGFNVQHDANHGCFSRYWFVNHVMAMMLDVALGVSSWFWKDKHVRRHNIYTNVPGADLDINLGKLARLNESQNKLWFHRWQHIYLWLLYSLITIRYLFVDLLRIFDKKKDYPEQERPRGIHFYSMVAGKAIHLSLVFVLPLLMHSWYKVLLVYLAISLVLGFIVAVFFQLTHTTDIVNHPKNGKLNMGWMEHQISTTSDFATDNWLFTFLTGGLGHQVSHHLFPNKYPHVLFPIISREVRRICEENGIRYRENKTFWKATASHYRFLKQMGQ